MSQERREYHQKYREDHREFLRSKDRARNDTRRIQRRKKAHGGKLPKCEFCGLLLTSDLAGKKAKRYCLKCRKDPDIIRYLKKMYQARYYAKKVGNEPQNLLFSEGLTD